MSTNSILSKIRQEIERLKDDYLNRSYTFVPAAMVQLLEFIDTLSEEPDKTPEEAAKEYEKEHTYQRYDGGGLTPEYDATLAESFIAGAEWQAEQDDRDVVFWKGMQYAIKGMKEDAVEGIYTKSMDGKNVFVESGALKIDPASVKVGDKVKLIIIKDDGKSD